MAAIARPPSMMDKPSIYSRDSVDSKRSSASSRVQKQSLGRGGAGNYGYPTPAEVDLTTPVLRSRDVTTGRGGAGNIAHNLSAEQARKLQDVEAQPPRRRESFHTGRGGAGNEKRSTEKDRRDSQAERDHYLIALRQEDAKQQEQRRSERGIADIGKELLFGKKH